MYINQFIDAIVILTHLSTVFQAEFPEAEIQKSLGKAVRLIFPKGINRLQPVAIPGAVWSQVQPRGIMLWDL